MVLGFPVHCSQGLRLFGFPTFGHLLYNRQVHRVKHLGADLNAEGDREIELKARIERSNTGASIITNTILGGSII